MSSKIFYRYKKNLEEIFTIFEPKLDENGVNFHLIAKHWVGLLSFDKYSVIINPKISNAKFGYMLSQIDSSVMHILPKISENVALDDGFFKNLLLMFLRKSIQILEISKLKGYIQKEINSYSIKGKILISPTIKSYISGNLKISQKYKILTNDNFLNQILKYTIEFIKPLIFSDMNIIFKELEILLSDVSILSEIRPIDIQNIHYNRLNEHYKEIISFCFIILKNNIIDISKGDATFNCFYINSWDVYEKYLRTLFSKYTPNQFNIGKKGLGKIFLDSWDPEKIQPDVIISKDNTPFLIVDAKYKDIKSRISQNDKNQASNYIRRLLIKKEIPLENRICIYIYPQTNQFKANMVTEDEKQLSKGKFYWHNIDLSKIDDEAYIKSWIVNILSYTAISEFQN